MRTSIRRRRAKRDLSRRKLWTRSSEHLEPRMMFSGSPPSIVVGRTLSSYFSGDVQNNREAITFTVYNQQATPISGVLLTDTLLSGVTFLDASVVPDQS